MEVGQGGTWAYLMTTLYFPGGVGSAGKKQDSAAVPHLPDP